MANKSKMTAVSIRADEPYHAALKEVARRRKMYVGDVVRMALDAYLGKELRAVAPFFLPNGNTLDHSDASAKEEKAS